MSPEGYRWLHARLHGELAAEVVRDSPAAVHKELLGCCERPRGPYLLLDLHTGLLWSWL